VLSLYNSGVLNNLYQRVFFTFYIFYQFHLCHVGSFHLYQTSSSLFPGNTQMINFCPWVMLSMDGNKFLQSYILVLVLPMLKFHFFLPLTLCSNSILIFLHTPSSTFISNFKLYIMALFLIQIHIFHSSLFLVCVVFLETCSFLKKI